MALPAGTRLGVYEIVGPLGAGGMGEVYRALDTRLNREVAIKVLPSAFAEDSERLRRFEREAQILASLNHPNIAHIHGLEESGSAPALVMELVEGEELADRIARGPIPIPEALPIAAQIVYALEAAHDRGIVHRDLKPANIRINSAGTVKVLDFGLAKALDPAADSDPGRANTPTVTSAATRAGLVLGTAAYMAPEQAKGNPVDKRADIWAFGCVLFEMLTGRRPFPGATMPETIAAVLEREPEWGRLPAATPPGIRRLLRRCLQKDPGLRLRDAADARLEIDDVRRGANDEVVAAAPARSRRRLAWQSAVALLALLGVASAAWLMRPIPASREMRLEITTPPTLDSSLAISPDGSKVVFAVRSAGQSQLWIRSLDSSVSRPLQGTEQGSHPFWSPDSKSIGFFAGATLKRVEIDGGSAQTLSSEVAVPLGGSWNDDGTILFSGNPGGPVMRVPARGGEVTPATRLLMPQQRGHFFPQFLPDRRHFLFLVSGSPEAQGVYVGQLDAQETTRLLNSAGMALYSPTGHLLFVRDGKLYAQGFDAGGLKLRGDPMIVSEEAGSGTALSISAAGPIVYRTGSADAGRRQFIWVDRSGRETDKVVYSDTAAMGPALSHDGRRVAVFRFQNGNMDLWVYDTRRHAWDRITFAPGDDIYPLWSPGDTSIVFVGIRESGVLDIYRKVLGTPPGSEELLLATAAGKFVMDWSADGRFLLYGTIGSKRGADIWALPMEGERKPFEVVGTEFTEGQPQFSPDGRWIAYQSDRTGRFEIYLRPFPGPGADLPASTDGGNQVRWNPKGGELFYIAADDRLMAVPISVSPDGKTIEPGTPAALFATNISSTVNLKYRQQYVVSPDGQSFMMNSTVERSTASPITVILNWKPPR